VLFKYAFRSSEGRRARNEASRDPSGLHRGTFERATPSAVPFRSETRNWGARAFFRPSFRRNRGVAPASPSPFKYLCPAFACSFVCPRIKRSHRQSRQTKKERERERESESREIFECRPLANRTATIIRGGVCTPFSSAIKLRELRTTERKQKRKKRQKQMKRERERERGSARPASLDICSICEIADLVYIREQRSREIATVIATISLPLSLSLLSPLLSILIASLANPPLPRSPPRSWPTPFPIYARIHHREGERREKENRVPRGIFPAPPENRQSARQGRVDPAFLEESAD